MSRGVQLRTYQDEADKPAAMLLINRSEKARQIKPDQLAKSSVSECFVLDATGLHPAPIPTSTIKVAANSIQLLIF